MVTQKQSRAVVVLCLLMMLAGAACSTWRPVGLDGSPLPARIRFQPLGQAQVEVTHPILEGDGLIGRVEGGEEEVRFSLKGMSRMEGRHFSLGRTLVLLVPSVYIVLLAATVAALPST